MLAVIKNETTLTFSLNGIDHPKNYSPLVLGDSLIIVGVYDTKRVILKKTHFSDIEVNSVVYTNINDCVTALTTLLHTKATVALGGALTSTDNTLKFHNSVEGIIHSPITGNLIIDTTAQIPGGLVFIRWSGSANPDITGVDPTLVESLGLTISDQGNYLITIVFVSGKYIVNIQQPIQYVGAGGGGTTVLPPSNLAAGIATQTTIQLTWDKSTTGVMTEYRAYIGGVIQQTFVGDVDAGTLTGLTEDTAYNDITMRAFDGTNESADSNSINVNTAPGASYATPSFVAASALASQGSLVAICNIPAGIQVGDLLLARISQDAITSTAAAPAGWTEEHYSNNSAGANNLSRAVFSKIADAADVAAAGTGNQTFSFNALGGTRSHGIMYAYRDVVAASFIESLESMFASDAAGSGLEVTNSQVTAGVNRLAVMLYDLRDDWPVTFIGNGYTEDDIQNTTAGNDYTFAGASELIAGNGGADGDVRWDSAAVSRDYGIISFYLAPRQL